MSDIILKVDNISKQYRLGLVGTGTLAHDLNRFWHRIRGKEDPYLQIGAVNDRSSEASSDYVWALKDINFEVKQGEVLGIIGKNGAGKSTLLKILSRVTSPTTGSMKTKGRIASLLEVGTGMHPELTGRENVYLNGAILGMNKTEISSKIDEIIEFSGCQMYIDTPVKRYSSGMRVRLGFAVAAFLEPDILVVDEVLAVGDVEFQKKAIGKMQDISNTSGRTVIFVSHNMAAVRNLCTTGLVIENGSVVYKGTSHNAVNFYLQSESYIKNAFFVNEDISENSDIVEVRICDNNNKTTDIFSFENQIKLKVKFTLTKEMILRNPIIGLSIIDNEERKVFTTQRNIEELNSRIGLNEVTIELPNSFLTPNQYRINLGFHIINTEVIRSLKNILSFKIVETGSAFSAYQATDYGCVIVNCNWIGNI